MKIQFDCQNQQELDAVLAFVDFLTEGETPRCVTVADIIVLPKEKENEKEKPRPCRCHHDVYDPVLHGGYHDDNSNL
jgi:hypothetical protein